MKKITILSAAAAALALLASCAREDYAPAGSDNAAGNVQTLTACFAPGETRTFFDGSTFKWKNGDAILVRSSNATNGYSEFTNNTGDTAGEVTFVNTSEDVITKGNTSFAYYPAVSGTKIEDNTLKPVLKSDYTWSEGNVQAPMLAKVEDGTPMQFKHLGGVLKVTYKNIPPKAQKLVVKAPVIDADLLAAGKKTYKICQTMNMTHNWTADSGFDPETPYLQAYDHSGDYSITVNISSATPAQRTSDDGVTVYIPLPVGPNVVAGKNVYPKLNIWLAFADNTVVPGSLRSATNVEIERAHIKPMPAISLPKYTVTTILGTGTANNDIAKKTDGALGTAVLGNVRGLCINGNTLYAMDANSTIRIVDISGATPSITATKTISSDTNVPWRGHFYDGKLYFADKNLSRLYEYNVDTDVFTNKKSLWGFPSSGNKSPMDIAFDAEGYPYVPIRDAYKIYKLPTVFTGSTPTVFADFSSSNSDLGSKDIQVTAVEFDANGDLLVLTASNGFAIYRVKKDGSSIKKIAGTGSQASSYAGMVDGNATSSATLTNNMFGLALDNSGNIYVGNRWGIRKITFTGDDYEGGVVTTIIGNESASATTDGVGANAGVSEVYDLEFNSDYSKLYFSQPNQGLIRVITIE